MLQKFLGWGNPHNERGDNNTNNINRTAEVDYSSETDQDCNELDSFCRVNRASSSLGKKTDIFSLSDISHEDPKPSTHLRHLYRSQSAVGKITTSDYREDRKKSAPICSLKDNRQNESSRRLRSSAFESQNKGQDAEGEDSSSSSPPFHLPILYELKNSSKIPPVQETYPKRKSRRSIYTQTDCENKKSNQRSIPQDPQGATQSVAVCKKFPEQCLQAKKCPMYSMRPVVYGELVVVGCNGVVPEHLLGHMNSRFTLRKRSNPNGLKEASYTEVEDFTSSEPYRCPTRRSVSYVVHQTKSIVVEYVPDNWTDMFQIGRYEKSPIDFRVLDVKNCEEARNGVSRFACRIVVQRRGDRQARIYAAAFDATGNIFLGEGGVTCLRGGKMDGFTTNGVLIMHPGDNFSKANTWREVSVCGYVYPLRSSQVEDKKRPRLSDETNVLRDGTLIDLCGITLMWRTPEGLQRTPSADYLKRLQVFLDDLAPSCSIVSCTLPRPRSKPLREKKEAYVYLSCGHVLGFVFFGQPPSSPEGWSCPVCRCICPIAKLTVGREPALYVDRELPSHAFRPCGHVTSLKTVKYWTGVKVPHHRNTGGANCPFCGVKLNFIAQSVKLVFPKKSDFVTE